MQDIHSGGGGRLFGGGDRRLRQHHSSHQQNHQPLKCPRCDSINTKFCYYNNYNISQPRHFCKNCRRYWTKGGVLRSVPVGGGCRKTKRSKQKVSSEISTATKDNSHSSSESSSLTATTTTTAATEAVSAPSLSSASQFLVANANPNPSFEAGSLLENQTSDCGIFTGIGNFTNMITSANEALTLGFGNISDVASFPASQFHLHHSQIPSQKLDEELRMHENPSGLLDSTANVDLSFSFQNRSTNVGFGSFDWKPSGDQGLFDLPNIADQAYWSQNQWTDRDYPSLFLP